MSDILKSFYDISTMSDILKTFYDISTISFMNVFSIEFSIAMCLFSSFHMSKLVQLKLFLFSHKQKHMREFYCASSGT